MGKVWNGSLILANDGLIAHQYPQKETCKNIGRKTSTIMMQFEQYILIPLCFHLSPIGYGLYIAVGIHLILQEWMNDGV